jgi:Xaa-Pro aminopeptidase
MSPESGIVGEPAACAATDDYARTGLARGSVGRTVADHGAGQIDMKALRAYRLARLQAELRRHGAPAILLADPINIRYATGMRNMQPWSMHSNLRLAFVPAQGRATLFEYAGSEHLAAGLETVAEVRPATSRFWAGTPGTADLAGDRKVRVWAAEIAELLRLHGGADARLAIDRHVDHFSARALEAAGITLLPGQLMLRDAQAIKSAEEIACMSASVAVAEAGMHRLRQALEPGRTEIELWSILERTNVEMGGEYMDTRLLSSGARTNPWYQEATDRVVRPGDLVALDTDMIGPFGYDADVSRTFFCGSGRPADAQRRLYALAWEQLQHNLALVRPGASFREMSERAYALPEEFHARQFSMIWHGVGLCGQWPTIVGRGFFATHGEAGTVMPGMTLCCESYVGAEGGIEGVKLEQQLVVTESGYELLTTFPFEEELLGREF